NPDGSTPSDNPFMDVRNTVGSFLTGANVRPKATTSIGKGSFTAFLNQKQDTLTVTVSFQGLSSPTLKKGAAIHFGGPGQTGPAILTLRDFPKGVSSGQFTFTLTKKDFKADRADGIKTFGDAVNAILSGKTYFDISTSRFRDGEIRGQISQMDAAVTNN